MELPTISFWFFLLTHAVWVMYMLYDKLQLEKQKNGKANKE